MSRPTVIRKFILTLAGNVLLPGISKKGFHLSEEGAVGVEWGAKTGGSHDPTSLWIPARQIPRWRPFAVSYVRWNVQTVLSKNLWNNSAECLPSQLHPASLIEADVDGEQSTSVSARYP